MQSDICVQVLYFAYKNNGLFKASQFRYIADPPRTWYQKDLLLKYMMEQGWFRRYRAEGTRVYIYQMTEKGRVHMEEHL